MNLPDLTASAGFPNGDCQAIRIPELDKLARCVSPSPSRCPYVLLYQEDHLCSHIDCQVIVQRTEGKI